MDLKTPLYDTHEAIGGKIVPFAGYLLPVQYATGVIKEHMAVREGVGLFDVSHMGEVFFEGANALACINHLLTNDFSGIEDGQVRYSPMCNDEGGIVDDLIVYRFGEEKYMIVVNASNRHKDVAWMRAHLTDGVVMTDRSDEIAELALQGPGSKKLLASLHIEGKLPAKYYHFTHPVSVEGIRCLISRTGYTGEFGYEIYCANADVTALWNLLTAKGATPCGLGARDTLRLEAAMPLYGHEMNDEVSPLETGLGWAVKADTHDFIGKSALRSRPVNITRVGLKITGRGIAREHQDVYAGDEKVGVTTSGTHLPYLGGAYAMALVDLNYAEPGATLQVDVRGRRIDAEVVPLPFYKRSK